MVKKLIFFFSFISYNILYSFKEKLTYEGNTNFLWEQIYKLLYIFM